MKERLFLAVSSLMMILGFVSLWERRVAAQSMSCCVPWNPYFVCPNGETCNSVATCSLFDGTCS